MNSQDVAQTTKKAFGKQVKVARQKKKLTQAEVAKKADMTTNYFAMIERGEVNPSYEKIKRIARVLSLKVTIS